MLGLGSLIRFARLRRLMSPSDALKFMRSNKEMEIFLKPLARKIFLRGGSTDIDCFEKIFLHEEYRSPFPLDNPLLIIDGGANVGMASLYFSTKYPNATIYAIEPEIENFKLLQRNCAENPNIRVRRMALWPTRSRLALSNYDRKENWTFAVSEGEGDVETITIDEILQESGKERIDILKLDVEGSERELFRNARWLDRVKQIIIELHDRYRAGCSRSFYSAVVTRDFDQEIRGENIFISFAA
jgi:FkbM family methyltransferase